MPVVTMRVNGADRALLVEAHETLLHALRERLGLTGTKCGCAEGSCGACTVLLDGVPVLSCLTPAARCDGRKVVTVEGIARRGVLHPVQRALVAKGGMQCGYCTPGIVVTAAALLTERSDPSEEEIREALSGNLCRCTGFAKIIEAVRAAAKEGGR